MLDQLHFRSGLIGSIECHDIGIEMPQPLDPKEAATRVGKAHGDFFLFFKHLLEVLDVKYQPLIRPFGRAFLINRRIRHTLGHRVFMLLIIGMNLAPPRHGGRFVGFGGCADLIHSRSPLAGLTCSLRRNAGSSTHDAAE